MNSSLQNLQSLQNLCTFIRTFKIQIRETVLSLNESTREARENIFYFTSRALFVLENSIFSNFMTSSNA